MSVCYRSHIQAFGPTLPFPAIFKLDANFKKFLLTKGMLLIVYVWTLISTVINAYRLSTPASYVQEAQANRQRVLENIVNNSKVENLKKFH